MSLSCEPQCYVGARLGLSVLGLLRVGTGSALVEIAVLLEELASALSAHEGVA